MAKKSWWKKFVDGYQMSYCDSYPLKMLAPDSETEIQALLKKKIALHPMRGWTDQLELQNGGWEGLPRTFIHCVGQEYSMSSETMAGPAHDQTYGEGELQLPPRESGEPTHMRFWRSALQTSFLATNSGSHSSTG